MRRYCFLNYLRLFRYCRQPSNWQLRESLAHSSTVLRTASKSRLTSVGLRPRRGTPSARIFHCSIPGRPRRGSALRCLSSLLRPGPLREGMTRSGTLNTDARNAGVAYMYCKPLRIGGMSSRDFRSNSMAAMSTSPNFIWGSRMVRIKFQILKIYGKTKETSPRIVKLQ